MGVKLKTKKYKRKHKCPRCKFTSNDKGILKRHRAIIHGDFGARKRILNSIYPEKHREVVEEDKEMKGKMICSGEEVDITYRYDDDNHKYRIYTDFTKFGKNTELVWNPKSNKFTVRKYKTLSKIYDKEHENGFSI